MAKVDPGGPITERADVVELLDKVPLTKLEQDAPKQVCCLTGATSLVGAHVVRRLLRAGHTVHAPVRGAADAPRLGYLKAMPGAAERLKVFGGCDLMVAGSYDASMVGCATVIRGVRRRARLFSRDGAPTPPFSVFRSSTSRAPSSSWGVRRRSRRS